MRGSYGVEEELRLREGRRLQIRNGARGQGAESRRRLPPQLSVTMATSFLGAPTSVLGTGIPLEGRVWGVVRKDRKQE